MAEEKGKGKRITLMLDADVVPWVDFTSARYGGNMTKAINETLRQARDNAPEKLAQAYALFRETLDTER